MLKRTKGLLLLTLLVITGLAGTIRDTSLSKKERKWVTGLMKTSKADFFDAVKGLSNAQLNFRESPDRWSIRECVYHIATSETVLWNKLEEAMKYPPNPEKRTLIKISDEDLVKGTEDRSHKVKTIEILEPKNASYKNLDEALTDFRSHRADHIKYMKNSTEDMRDHVVEMQFGWIDCYQLSLMIAAHTDRHKQQIEEVKANSRFPRK